jgi:hypothetical protein
VELLHRGEWPEQRRVLGDDLAPIPLKQLAAALPLGPRRADEAKVRRAEEEPARHDGVGSHQLCLAAEEHALEPAKVTRLHPLALLLLLLSLLLLLPPPLAPLLAAVHVVLIALFLRGPGQRGGRGGSYSHGRARRHHLDRGGRGGRGVGGVASRGGLDGQG